MGLRLVGLRHRLRPAEWGQHGEAPWAPLLDLYLASRGPSDLIWMPPGWAPSPQLERSGWKPEILRNYVEESCAWSLVR
eukprot:6352356-Prorocentrum_lima.AAC.1